MDMSDAPSHTRAYMEFAPKDMYSTVTERRLQIKDMEIVLGKS